MIDGMEEDMCALISLVVLGISIAAIIKQVVCVVMTLIVVIVICIVMGDTLRRGGK